MDQKQIGRFLKKLRKEKGITQEQLAELLNISNRTVSRWETGTNLPDLSVLIELSEYYDIDIKDIFNAERKEKEMNNEIKETLLKVADYDDLKKRKAASAGNLAFSIMFITCCILIVLQMLISGNMSLIVGETVIFVIGEVVYLTVIVRNGLWNTVGIKNISKNNLIISITCTGVFSIIMFFMLKGSAETEKVLYMVFLFFIIVFITSYLFLKLLSHISKKHENDC